MSVIITTVDLDGISTGMQFIDGSATAENLIHWLTTQLRRLSIDTSMLSSACIDNAANISNAMTLDPALCRIVMYCCCHLINVAVKRSFPFLFFFFFFPPKCTITELEYRPFLLFSVPYAFLWGFVPHLLYL